MTRQSCPLFVLALLLGVLVPVRGPAQEPPAARTGTVVGRVVDRTSNAPVPSAEVLVAGTTRRARTDADGRFRLANVPAGPAQLRVQRVGYSSATQSVSVVAGEEATVNFAVYTVAVSLDAVVTTATGETQRRRESGAATSVIDTSMVNLAAAPTLASVISSRTAGVTVQTSGGTTGTSTRIRIRGSNSINLSNEPLVIVDGTRVNNAVNAFQIGVGGQTISRLEDFNPEDIESYEFIKGPAAAALYGTAAANGVIQITTKRGRAGPTRWHAYEEYGTIKDYYDYPNNWARIGTTVATGLSTQACTLEREVLGICTPKADSLVFWNPIENVSPFRTGWRQTHGLGVNGGTQQTTYYLAGEYEREQGVYDPNYLRRISGRTNLRSQLRPDLDASLSVGYVRNRIRLPYNDNSAFGAIAAGFLGKAFDCSPTTYRTTTYCATDSLSRGYFNANIPSTQYFNIDNQQQLDRLTASIASNWTPLSWLRALGNAGLDIINREDAQLIPPNKVFFSQTTVEGSRFVDRRRVPTYNASATLTATYKVPWGNIGGQSSIGTQFTREESHSSNASGAILLPGTGSLGGTSARFSVGETNQEIVTVGGYVNQQLSYQDRLFLTLALRTDRGSTFGSEFGWIKYPAASLSWVVSEEPFFPRPEFLSEIRLRAAYGESGQRPGFREAETWFNPVAMRVGTVEVPAITLGGTGNPDLRPEKSREYEGGFDASLFGNRLGLELTGYVKRTEDAIINRRLAPSLGATVSRLENLGEVENKGIEALLTATVIERENLKWESTFSYSENRNRLIKLGQGITPILFGFGSTQQHRNGYPVGGYFKRKILSFQDLDENGIITRINCPAYGGTANPQLAGGPRCEVVLSDSVEYLGSPLPLRELALNTGLTLFRYVRVSALFDYRGGYKLFNSTAEFRCTLGVPNCREVYDKRIPLSEQARVVARYMGTEAGYIEDASFVKLRELSLTLSAPEHWASRAKVSGLSLTVAGRNLATWTDYTGLDPEVNSNSGTNFTTSDFLAQPPVRYFTTRLNIHF